MEIDQPTELVLQCGSDALSRDRLGCFNLSARVIVYPRSSSEPNLLSSGESSVSTLITM